MGPRYNVQPDATWEQHLAEQHVEAWYHNSRLYAAARRWGLAWLARLIAPRGYSQQDQAGGATPGDLVVVTQTTHDLAAAAWRRLHAGGAPTRRQCSALKVVLHEHTHCMVGLDAQGTPIPADLETYSHPATALPALRHARRRDYPLNAFTGLLRWHYTPADACDQGMQWFGGMLTA